ncbi:MAG: BTAD domain-containing putative transcriptional regulator [Alphaproteobacteria bacterium]|jgi:DNA-binding SARP family transcriptional activator/Tfp pilus assembly protein PilF|nr:BTAD domain-containing putative transcriptional regulator [Alphaproteobacteria bacterium]MDP6832287.1 BTAD domain-containing putative transcriptional regulator [Alphaproteobacteria bacterium]
MKTLAIKVFGQLTVTDETAAPVAVTGKKRQALLAYLSLNLDRPPSRDDLMTLLWGDRFENQARQSLRECVSRLRKSLGGEAGPLRADRNQVWLERDLVRIDAQTLSQLAHLAASEKPVQPAQLVATARLYAGPLLAGAKAGQDGFDEWLRAERIRYNEAAVGVLERLASLPLNESEVAAAGQLAQQTLAFDPLNERAHLALMRVHLQAGQPGAAIQQYLSCGKVLEAELQVKPGERIQALYEQITSSGPKGAVAEKPAPPEQGAAATINALPGQAHKPRITVRPFTSLSLEPDQEFFATGITADIVSALARNRWLSVIAHHASTDFQAAEPLDAIEGEESGFGRRAVDYLVEGSIRKAGERVRVTAQLLDAASREHIWSERYDREVADIFALQDEITETIAARIEPVVGAEERSRVLRRSTENLDAWSCYHLGLAAFYKFTAEDNLEAQAQFQRCIELDPEFGAAYAWWSYALVLSMVYFDTVPSPEALDAALAAASKAVAIDDQNAVFHMMLGRVHLARCEYDEALANLTTALERNPGLAMAHCGMGDSLAYEGQLKESIGQFERAIQLSPNDPQLWAFYTYRSLAHFFAGEYEETAHWAQKATRLPNCQYWAHAHLTAALGQLGRESDGAAARAALLRLQPEFSLAFAKAKLFYIKRPEQLSLYLEGLRKAGLPA